MSIEKEKNIINLMIDIYFKHHDNFDKNKIKNYAFSKIDKCPFIETKTFCSECKIHCYESDMREQIKTIMRYSGKRMIFYHPILTIKHLFLTIKRRLTTLKRNRKE